VSKLLLIVPLLFAGCSADSTPADPDPGSDDPGMNPPPDDFTPQAPPVDDGYVPKAMTASRFGVFYQLSSDVLDEYQDATHGLPQVANHAWLITQSHATAFASRAMADRVHQRADFYYAPAFDVWDASHHGWQTADDATLATMAHQFRDAAIAAHADLFTLNECPSTTGSSPNVRVHLAKLLRYLHEPDAQGRQLFGVVYFTEQAGTVSKWDGPASDFFAAIDETSVALVVEHYHSNGFVCAQSESALADHYFALRRWLDASGEPAKVSIANSKYTVLHSARFSDGPSGWAGGDATKQSLANYQRALSRVAKLTRETDGGLNRISFAPVSTGTTDFGVQPRITELFRWHYSRTAPVASEEPCVDNYGGNCSCQ
jgi:hypothetical protein